MELHSVIELAKFIFSCKWLMNFATNKYHAMINKNTEVLIVGPGGVGKSTLSKIITHNFHHIKDSVAEYTESLSAEKIKSSKPHYTVVTLPGQKHRREYIWNDYFSKITDHTYRGVILVLSYGYHSIGKIKPEEHRLWKGSNNDFLHDLITDNLSDEIDIIKNLTSEILRTKKKTWLLIYVSKEDLWHDDREAVTKFYETGNIKRIIDDFHAQSGIGKNRVELIYGSLLIRNFRVGNVVLKENVQGYDNAKQSSSLDKLLTSVASLKEWEREHD